MNINIKATQIELSPALQNYVDKRLKKLGKFLDESESPASVQVEIGKETDHHKQGEVFRAEINIDWQGKRFRAEAVKDDLYAAIDAVKDDIANEIKRARRKDTTLLRRGGRMVKNIIRGMYPFK